MPETGDLVTLRGLVQTVFLGRGHVMNVTWDPAVHQPLVSAGFVAIDSPPARIAPYVPTQLESVIEDSVVAEEPEVAPAPKRARKKAAETLADTPEA